MSDRPREVIQFETSWGLVKCQDETNVWFPRFFGECLASKIKSRKTFVTLTFDKPVDTDALDKANERIAALRYVLEESCCCSIDSKVRCVFCDALANDDLMKGQSHERRA